MAPLALLSTSDKTGLVEFAQRLVNEFQFDILSSGGTAAVLKEAGIPVTKVSDYTESPEILGGRVKTLHPRIHGGILARRNLPEDLAELETNNIRPIDLVVVNLYPFEQTIAKPDVAFADAIENIDIGGPTLIRAAAKNHAHLTVLCNPSQYDDYLSEFEQYDGNVSAAFRLACAQQAFWHTANYDQAIATYLSSQSDRPTHNTTILPNRFTLSGQERQPLRYGENPHQSAIWYQTGTAPSGWAAAEKLQGKELSYNNLVDLEAARRIITEFEGDRPTVAILKHTNPCGVALGDTLLDAYQRALAADAISAFGGIVALNRTIDVQTAEAMTQMFLECVVAPACEPDAQDLLMKKSKLRVLILPDLRSGPTQTVRAIAGGFLVQQSDDYPTDPTEWEVLTERKPTTDELEELMFAWRVAKHVKSNGIVVTRDRTTLGIGAGQMNRVGAVDIALRQAGEQAQGATLASDGFFPFDDSVRTAAQAGITAIVQPAGSLRDQDSVDAANELGLVMVKTGVRHFLH